MNNKPMNLKLVHSVNIFASPFENASTVLLAPVVTFGDDAFNYPQMTIQYIGYVYSLEECVFEMHLLTGNLHFSIMQLCLGTGLFF